MSDYRVWTCKIVVPGDAVLPHGFDWPPRMGATQAVEAAGIKIISCFSGWGGELTEGEREFIKEQERSQASLAQRIAACCPCKTRPCIEKLEDVPRTFEAIKAYLGQRDIEGIVWHHPDGRIVKIKKRDFFGKPA